MADVQGLTGFFLVTLLSAVSWSQCGFQTAGSVEWEGERVPGAAEELRLQEAGTDRCAEDCSSCHWRQDLQLLEFGVFFMVVLEIKAPFNAIFICIVYKRVRVWSIRSFMHNREKKISFRIKGIPEKYCSLAFLKIKLGREANRWKQTAQVFFFLIALTLMCRNQPTQSFRQFKKSWQIFVDVTLVISITLKSSLTRGCLQVYSLSVIFFDKNNSNVSSE